MTLLMAGGAVDNPRSDSLPVIIAALLEKPPQTLAVEGWAFDADRGLQRDSPHPMPPQDQQTEIPQGFLEGQPASVGFVEDAVSRALGGRSLNLGEARADVHQEALRRLVVSFRAGQFRGDAALATYIHKVAFGAAIDHWRKVRRRREEQADESAEAWQRSTPADQNRAIETVETRRLVDRLLSDLGPPCRELLARVYFDEATHAAIAETLGKSEGAVKVQVHRCRQEAGRLLRQVKTGGWVVTRGADPTPNPVNAK